ncbi:hypothetical protein AMTR_s00070p00200710 [Amborella trichopoda]|uniref:Uncharacterized protein n=1 Tax=Amborella trichopoda TaxID=13333 RepID=U5DDQ4_AMBTC|nr:hypothetical protein AMTR_s00070p00200710 [Amborella trichopoda]
MQPFLSPPLFLKFLFSWLRKASLELLPKEQPPNTDPRFLVDPSLMPIRVEIPTNPYNELLPKKQPPNMDPRFLVDPSLMPFRVEIPTNPYNDDLVIVTIPYCFPPHVLSYDGGTRLCVSFPSPSGLTNIPPG